MRCRKLFRLDAAGDDEKRLVVRLHLTEHILQLINDRIGLFI